MLKKVARLKLPLVLMLSILFLVAIYQPIVSNAEPESEIPSWAEPEVDIVYAGSLWEYYPATNVSSTIAYMEQNFNIGLGNFTPNLYWNFGLFKFTVISADEQQGTFQVQSGTLGLYGYEWHNENVIWNYIWENQTWTENGTQLHESRNRSNSKLF